MKLILNAQMQKMNTMNLPFISQKLVVVEDSNELPEIVAKHGQPDLILGGGSNILVTTLQLNYVLKIETLGKKILQENEENLLVEFQAGENWHAVVTWAVENNFGGIENLALIPGTCGAGPIQNIGAYGVELGDVLHSVQWFSFKTGEFINLEKAECAFGYRNSIFKNELKNKGIITAIRLKLSKTKHQLKLNYKGIPEELEHWKISKPTIQDIFKAVVTIRTEKLPDPKIEPNTGSFFKNPIINKQQFNELLISFPNLVYFELETGDYKIPAAWLIENAGFKGKKNDDGNVGTSPVQPLVIINYGSQNVTEILDFVTDLKTAVKQKFGIQLQEEVNLV